MTAARRGWRQRAAIMDLHAQEVALAEAHAALTCIPQTPTRILWQSDPANVRAFVAALERYVAAGGRVEDFERATGVGDSVLHNLRAGRTSDGKVQGPPAPDARDGVREAAALVVELRKRVRAAGLRRVDWGRYPDDLAAIGRAWVRSRLALSTFARAIGIDPTLLKLHFRTVQGDGAREALQDALERITMLEARLAEAEHRAAEAECRAQGVRP